MQRTRRAIGHVSILALSAALVACATGASDVVVLPGDAGATVPKKDASVGSPEASFEDDASFGGDPDDAALVSDTYVATSLDGSVPSLDGGIDGATPPVDAGTPSDAGAPIDAGVDSGNNQCNPPPGNNHLCGLAPQCGCGADQTCTVSDSMGSTGCVSAGNVPEGSVCGSTENCAQGLYCYDGICHAFCSTPGNACDSTTGDVCYAVDATNAPDLNLCASTCDLRNPATYCNGQSCVYVDTNTTDCSVAGSGLQGDSCTDSTDCAAGYRCVSFTASEVYCQKWCRIGHSDCAGGQTCNAFATAPVVNGVTYGFCD